MHLETLRVVEKHHETFVHMILLVAVEEGCAGVVGGELDVGFGFGVDQDDVFVDAAEVWRAGKAAQFETVPVQVDGMVIAAGVFEDEAVALAGFEERAFDVGPGFAVDGPVIGGAVAGEFGCEDEGDFDDGIGGGLGHFGGELGVVPEEFFGLLPHWLAGAIGVFDDDTHTGGLDVFADFAHDPDAGVVHFNDGADALGGGEAQHGDELWRGDGVAIEGEDAELVAGEGEPVLLGGAGVEDVE